MLIMVITVTIGNSQVAIQMYKCTVIANISKVCAGETFRLRIMTHAAAWHGRFLAMQRVYDQFYEGN